MNIKKGSSPQRCVRCLRDKNEAIREHLRTNTPCCAQCPLGSIINEALDNRDSYAYLLKQKEQNNHDIMEGILGFVIWVVIGISVYFITYEILEWSQLWAILTAIFWPLAFVCAIYYYIAKLIIGFV